MSSCHPRSMLVENFLSVVVLSCLVISGFCDESTHTFDLSAIMPASSCEATDDDKGGSNIRIVHKHGPCVQGLARKSGPISHEQQLAKDTTRAKCIQSNHFRPLGKTGHSKTKHSNPLESKTKGGSSGSLAGGLYESKASIPAIQAASAVGASNYIAQVGLGTPQQQLHLIFDTGSSLTWTQCEPCVGDCYSQKDPKFDPSKSTSYANISCSDALCSDISTATGFERKCTDTTCNYGIEYGDQSFSSGWFGKDVLSLTPAESFKDFLFGCGQNNEGLFDGAAGMLGLGQDKFSVVVQTAALYNQSFTYCLPSRAGAGGYLAFGSNEASGSVAFTPMTPIPQLNSFYGITIEGITVAGEQLAIPPRVFLEAPSIIDSGTVVSRFPPTAYRALSTAFQQQMTRYPKAPNLAILDACYDLSNQNLDSVVVPKVSILFQGGVSVDLDPSGLLYVQSPSQVCLAFAPNPDDADILIFGNMQQAGMPVVYDVAGSRIGFGPKGCK